MPPTSRPRSIAGPTIVKKSGRRSANRRMPRECDDDRCADRRRRTGRADACDRSGLARHRRDRGGDARPRRAAGAEMQSRRRPHHGNFPPARHRRKGPQCRIAGGLSARHQLSHLLHRAGADADQDSLPPRPLHRRPTARTATGRRRSRRIASTRSFSSRSCSSMRPRSRASASSTAPRSRTSWSRTTCADVALRDLDTGERAAGCSCRFLIGCDGARSIVRKAIGAELTGDAVIQRVQSTFIRAPGLIDRQQHERAWGTGVDQSAPLRHGLCDRRPRALAGAQLSEARRGPISKRSIATPASAPSSASVPISNTRSSRKRTGTAAA